MEKIEVDPKLFITCRLCLEDLGVYQIIPIIQQKIKYCYDIDVAPFDSLPQLICKTCESKLSEYYTQKTIFINKQKSLLDRVPKKDVDITEKSVTSSPQTPPLQTPLFKTALLQTAPLQTTAPQTENANEQTQQVDSTSGTTYPKEIINEEIINDTVKENVKEVKIHLKRRFNFPTSDSDNDVRIHDKILPKKSHQRISNHWRKKYTTHFICRFCSASCSKRSALFKHYSKYHSNMQKYAHIIHSFCTVNMNRIDNRPNITGKLDAVVLSKDNIIRNEVSNKYYIVHQLKKKHESTAVKKKRIDDRCSDSSDDILTSINKKRRRKVNRLLSTDTVVIDKQDDDICFPSDNEDVSGTNTKHNPLDITECINIDSETDTGQSETIENAPQSSTSIKEEPSEDTDAKTMRHIVEACHARHVAKSDLAESSCPAKSYADIETQLKHKILSLGRKLVNKEGLNCAGLLRFMEHRNLGIRWLPRASNKNPFHVRMNITTLRRDDLNNDDNDIGWTNISPHPRKQHDESFNGPLRELNHLNTVFNKTPTVEGGCGRNLLEKSQEKVNTTSKDLNHAVLYKNADSDLITNGKLLNASPVANPKQLPKPVYHYEAKFIKNKIDNNAIEIVSNDQSILIEVDDEENVNTNLCMPIITSTTSLATTKEGEQVQDKGNKDNNFVSTNKQISEGNNLVSTNKHISEGNNFVSTNNQILEENILVSTNKQISEGNNFVCTNKQILEVSHMPRIKVKPVSELMADKEVRPNDMLLKSAGQNIWQPNQTLQNVNTSQSNVNFFPQLVLTPVTISQSNLLIQHQASNTSIIPAPPCLNNLSDNTEYIVLNTVEMPNAKTSSPFDYLQRLMNMHSISVWDTIPSAQVGICILIKFRVLFKQENLNPVVLCLSLYYSRSNTFSLVIKDERNKYISMREMSVNWQWEILKIYQGDVVNKILDNAIKTGLQVFEDTKKFLLLLQSINRVLE